MKSHKKIVIPLILLGLIFSIYSCTKEKEKEKGCTDATAINYDASAKEDDNSCIYEKYYRAEFGIVTTVSNDCGLVLAIDTNNNGVTEIVGHPVNLDTTYQEYDTLWVQYKLLPDSFYCHIFGGVVGGNFNPVFSKIEITKIKK